MIRLNDEYGSDNLLTVQDVAEMLNVSPSMVYGLVERGTLACYRIGRCVRFTNDQVSDFLEKSLAKNEPSKPRPRLRHL